MSKGLRIGLMTVGLGLALLAFAYVVVTTNSSRNAAQGKAITAQSTKTESEQRVRLADLARDCASSFGQRGKGFGEVVVDRKVVVSNENGEIAVPCNVRLKPGGELKLNNVELRSKNLIISDFGPNGRTRVQFDNSDLVGSRGEAAFLVQLHDAGDRVSIHRSTLDYPDAVWARAGASTKAGEDGGRIDVTASTLRSMAPKGDGIELMVGGDTGIDNFVDLELETAPLDPALGPGVKNVLLLAGECHRERVQGYDGACDPDDPALREQR